MKKNRLALTLMELLIVIGILAALAGLVVVMLGGAQDDASYRLAQTELAEIKKAVLRFKQDTGFLPKQGPFALTTDGGKVPVPAQGKTWFDSPANFGQLYDNPLTGTGHALEKWDPTTGRGWRGPYLSRKGGEYVDIGANLLPDGSGSPVAGTVLSQVPGVADSFQLQPAGSYLAWRSQPGGSVFPHWGRPYLIFGLNLTDPDQVREQARIVCCGPNGKYESNAAGTGGDDLVVYLFK